MKSKLLDYIKDKALNNFTKDQIVYRQTDDESSLITLYRIKPYTTMTLKDTQDILFSTGSITYAKFYKEVLKKIEHFKTMSLDKSPYLLVFNDYNSVANLVALLYLGYSPILINGHECMIAFPGHDDYLEEQTSFLEENKIINDYKYICLQKKKFANMIDNIKNSKIINEPKEGSIGVFSSGSSGNPKIVYVSEEKIINNILSSNYVNEDRGLYNVSSMSNISGLVTNVYMPFVLKNCGCHLSNTFYLENALKYKDIYLPRNIQDYLPKNKMVDGSNIERIFILGGINNTDTVNEVRKKIKLKDNVFVNVYGCTECGGLISEFEEKDFNELTIYKFDINGDYILYGYTYSNGQKEIQKKYGLKKESLYMGDIKGVDSNGIKVIPCGLASENKIQINGKNIGECIVDGYHTGDIGVIFDNKIFILGRKEYLEKYQAIGSFDAAMSGAAGFTCSTFINEYRILSAAVKYPIYSKEYDKTTRFRELVSNHKNIVTAIRNIHYVDDVIFLTESEYNESSGLKKPIISSIQGYLKKGRELNNRLDHFYEYLGNHIGDVCKEKLGYIPKWKITDKHILLSKKDITLEQIPDLLNDLSIVFVDEDDNNYIIYYDDRYYFAPNKGKYYTDEEIAMYKEYAKHNLFIERLAQENNDYAETLSYELKKPLKTMKKAIVHCMEGITENGDVILIPYYYNIALQYNLMLGNGVYGIKETGELLVKEAIKEKYNNISFNERVIQVPIPFSLKSVGSISKAIRISKDGQISYELINEEKVQEETDYVLSLVARMYNNNYNNLNKCLIK